MYAYLKFRIVYRPTGVRACARARVHIPWDVHTQENLERT